MSWLLIKRKIELSRAQGFKKYIFLVNCMKRILIGLVIYCTHYNLQVVHVGIYRHLVPLTILYCTVLYFIFTFTTTALPSSGLIRYRYWLNRIEIRFMPSAINSSRQCDETYISDPQRGIQACVRGSVFIS